ncbi:hypothetical protein ACSBR2_007001 [Camellia fascicularis]
MGQDGIDKYNVVFINKACAKFRKKNFGTSRADGDGLYRGISYSIGAQPFVDPIPARAKDVDSNSSIELVQADVKRKRTPSSSYGKSKKATSGASIIAESMNNLTNVVRNQNQQVTVRHLTSNESLYTISECIQRLRNIISLLGTPLFHYASTLMENTDSRKVMMCQPDDDHIGGWLTQKQLQSSAAAPFANLNEAPRV